jgi:hypothetical protein
MGKWSAQQEENVSKAQASKPATQRRMIESGNHVDLAHRL